MGLIDDFRGKIVFIDTAPIIYFLEGKPENRKKLFPIFQANDFGKFQLQTSIITLTEVLVLPFRLGKKDLVRRYKKILLQSPHFVIHELNAEIGIKAAEIRATKQFKTPDAFQIATAIVYGADFFLTNDKALNIIENVQVIVLDDLE